MHVKFSKMESISGLWDDDKASTITADGEYMGEITGVRAARSFTNMTLAPSRRVQEYDVEIWTDVDDDGTHVQKTFEVKDYSSARAALSAAKRFCVEFINR